MTEQREYIITEEQLRYIRDDCVYPNGAGCDGCEFANTDEMDCAFDSDKVMDDVRSRPYTNEREKGLDYMINDIETHTDAVHGTVT